MSAFQPRAYADSSFVRDFVGCHLEARASTSIFWFHWPRDGFFRWEDFEPVVVVSDKEGKLCLVILRVGWRYQVYDAEEVSVPLEVVFRDQFHHPLLRTLSNQEDFDNLKKRLVTLEVSPTALRLPLPDVTINGIPPFRSNFYDKIEAYRLRSCV
jgi:hypothetical protein